MEYRVFVDGLDDGGILHYADSESAGFPLCGKNYRLARPETVQRAVCFSCREAAGRAARRHGQKSAILVA